MRLPAEQTSPWLKKTPKSAPSTAGSKSASAKKMFGDLPPSSSVTFFNVAAAARMIVLPTSALPVNAILSTSGCATIAAPAVSPTPVTTLTTPGGRPASAELGELIRAVADDIRQLEQDPPAILRGRVLPRPLVERRARGFDRLVDVGGARVRHAANRLAGRRIDDVERFGRRRRDEFAVYIE